MDRLRTIRTLNGTGPESFPPSHVALSTPTGDPGAIRQLSITFSYQGFSRQTKKLYRTLIGWK
jgi:hypothetical protein